MINVMSSSGILDIRLLGPVKILYQDTQVKIRRRAARAMLYYLAAEHRAVSRSHLTDLFWPDGTNADPRQSLRTTLSRLRNDLPDPDILQTDLDQVFLDLTKCQVDLFSFESQFHGLQTLLKVYPDHRPLPDQIVSQVDSALKHWRGAHIIEGDPIDNYPGLGIWYQTIDRQLRHERDFLQFRLADHYRLVGKLDTALALYFQLKQWAPFDQRVHENILDALSILGRHQEALTFCDELEQLYEQHFNQPLPEAILERCRHSQNHLVSKENQPVKVWPLPVGMQLELVGRQPELEKLQQAFLSGGIAVIQGEGGSGKTRLVQELYQTVFPSPKLILAPGHPLEDGLPLAPIIASLRRDIPELIWKTLSPVWIGVLSCLLPELVDFQDIPQPTSQEDLLNNPQPIFKALYEVLVKAAKNDGRVLFFLDDAQWADNLTLQALAYFLSTGFFDQYGLLVIAFRTEEPRRALSEFIKRVQRHDTVQQIALEGLNSDDLSLLTQQVFGQELEAGLIERLFRETNGNPFIAIEILRTILESPDGLESLASNAPLPLPENVRALISQRMDQLDQLSREFLIAAAVLGTSFPIRHLTAVFPDQNPSALDILETLMVRGFLISQNGAVLQEAHLRFVHEKIREVVLLESSEIKLQHYHLRAAQVLMSLPRPQARAALIARHFQAAGKTKLAFTWFLQAADHAWSLGAQDESLKAYQRAEHLFKNTSVGFFSNDEVLKLYEQWGEFAYQSAQAAMSEKVALKLLYLGERENSPLLQGVAQTALSSAYYLRHRFPEAIDMIGTAIKNLQSAGPSKAAIEAHIRQGALFLWTSRYQESIASYDQALELYRAYDGEEDLTASKYKALYQISLAHYAAGHAKKALEQTETIYQQYFPQASAFNRIRILSALANAHLLFGDFKSAQQAAQRGLDMAQDLGTSFIQEDLLITLSRAELLAGKLEHTYLHGQRACELGQANRHMGTVIRAKCVLGDVFNLLQNYSQAIDYYRQAQNIEGFLKLSYHSLENNIHLARVLLWMGEMSEARKILDQSKKETERIGMRQLQAQAVVISGIGHLVENRPEESAREFEKAQKLVEEYSLRHEALWVLIGQARLAMTLDEHHRAEMLLQKLLTQSLDMHSPWTALNAVALLRQLVLSGKSEIAIEKLRRHYHQILGDLSAHIHMKPLRRDFQKSRQRWDRGHFYP